MNRKMRTQMQNATPLGSHVLSEQDLSNTSSTISVAAGLLPQR
jgi:hypothetical protein